MEFGEGKPTVLEYARFHGLIRNYRATNPLDIFEEESAAAQLKEVHGLYEIDQHCHVLPERLTATKEAAALLSWVHNIAKPGSINPDDLLPDYRRVRRMKVELPLLSSDHELDVIHFKRRIVPDLANEHLSMETLNDELDEGVGWPSSNHEARRQARTKSETEKLVFPKEALKLLSEALKPPSTDVKDQVIQEEVQKLMRVL